MDRLKKAPQRGGIEAVGLSANESSVGGHSPAGAANLRKAGMLSPVVPAKRVTASPFSRRMGQQLRLNRGAMQYSEVGQADAELNVRFISSTFRPWANGRALLADRIGFPDGKNSAFSRTRPSPSATRVWGELCSYFLRSGSMLPVCSSRGNGLFSTYRGTASRRQDGGLSGCDWQKRRLTGMPIAWERASRFSGLGNRSPVSHAETAWNDTPSSAESCFSGTPLACRHSLRAQASRALALCWRWAA